MALTIGVDVGGTTVAAGVVDEQGGMLATVRHDTPSDDPRRTEDVIADVVRELMASHDVEAVGVGAAGFVDAQRATVLFAPNLAWRDEPLRAAIERRCGLPVVIENDANAAAWAEARFGAGRGEDHVVILTIGTGLGGGIVPMAAAAWPVRHRRGDRARQYRAPRAAVRVRPRGVLGAVRERAGAGSGGPGARQGRARAGQDMLRLAGASRSDHGPGGHRGRPGRRRRGAQCFDVVGTWLGRGMAQLSAVLDPGVFVLGGGVSAAGELVREPACTRSYSISPPAGIAHTPSCEHRLRSGLTPAPLGAADRTSRATWLAPTRVSAHRLAARRRRPASRCTGRDSARARPTTQLLGARDLPGSRRTLPRADGARAPRSAGPAVISVACRRQSEPSYLSGVARLPHVDAPAGERAAVSLPAPVVLERDTEPDTKIHDGAVLDRQVLAHDLGHP